MILHRYVYHNKKTVIRKKTNNCSIIWSLSFRFRFNLSFKKHEKKRPTSFIRKADMAAGSLGLPGGSPGRPSFSKGCTFFSPAFFEVRVENWRKMFGTNFQLLRIFTWNFHYLMIYDLCNKVPTSRNNPRKIYEDETFWREVFSTGFYRNVPSQLLQKHPTRLGETPESPWIH